MSTIRCLSFLRPYAVKPLARRKDIYLRFYQLGSNAEACSSTRATSLCHQRRSVSTATGSQAATLDSHVAVEEVDPAAEALAGQNRSKEVEKRIKELTDAGALQYPRHLHPDRAISCLLFTKLYRDMKPGEPDERDVTLQGRVLSVRKAGSKLAFLDIVQGTYRAQIMVNLNKMPEGTTADTFKAKFKILKRGDHIRVLGRPVMTPAGQLTLEAIELPNVVSPSLVPIPEKLIDDKTRMQHRHLDLIINPTSLQTLKLRSVLIRKIREFLTYYKFYEVETPILAASSGGAVARPFATSATEFPHRELSLRIAPELWLKRLVVGGMDRIFELGPAFRNEGLDATHNPEFTTCEAYAAYFSLPKLIFMTEDLLHHLAKRCVYYHEEYFDALPKVDDKIFAPPYKQVDFIPSLQMALGFQLPNLESPTALADLTTLLESNDMLAGVSTAEDAHTPPSLPKLLDRLAAAYLEPLSESAPIFIIHHPACMSPLSKTFTCPNTGQTIAARAELFFGGRELANMYEEENDPFEQRRKFERQAEMARAEGKGGEGESWKVVDESYIGALECGLPPTGGWGCGIDRIVMMFSGAKRIGDVLSFGSLRNVVGVQKAEGF